jgi:phosphoribosylanthranilate isomerase
MTLIKVCGLTNYDDAQAAIDAGADMLGFIFYAKSPRAVEPGQVCEMISKLDFGERAVLKIGVFVNEATDDITTVLKSSQLDAAQLHGEEPAEMLGLGRKSDVGSRLTGRAYKAIRPASVEEATLLVDKYNLPVQQRMDGRLPALLVDSFNPLMRGGTGKTGDWHMAARIALQYPILLAGGLTPENIGDAVRAVHPWGVDISSGIESTPGKKDHAALRNLIRAVKTASGKAE